MILPDKDVSLPTEDGPTGMDGINEEVSITLEMNDHETEVMFDQSAVPFESDQF